MKQNSDYEKAYNEFKEDMKDFMVKAFKIANETYDELKKQRIYFGDKDHTICMIAREVFREMLKE